MAEAPKENRPKSNWRLWLMLLAVMIIPSITAGLKNDWGSSLGYWPTVVAAGVVGAGAVLVICVLLKLGWRAGLAIGVNLSITLNTFYEVKSAVQASLGALATVAISVTAACVLGMAAMAVMNRLLKLKWNRDGLA